jgi:hypothetical protein
MNNVIYFICLFLSYDLIVCIVFKWIDPCEAARHFGQDRPCDTFP